jgi:hypothetical protein
MVALADSLGVALLLKGLRQSANLAAVLGLKI